jgi:hypothetical protein
VADFSKEGAEVTFVKFVTQLPSEGLNSLLQAMDKNADFDGID